jgi:hypothetical protein
MVERTIDFRVMGLVLAVNGRMAIDGDVSELGNHRKTEKRIFHRGLHATLDTCRHGGNGFGECCSLPESVFI